MSRFLGFSRFPDYVFGSFSAVLYIPAVHAIRPPPRVSADAADSAVPGPLLEGGLRRCVPIRPKNIQVRKITMRSISGELIFWTAVAENAA